MKEKQVILAKTEYDEMEKELHKLKLVVESRTIAKIFVPLREWRYHNPYLGNVDGINVKYISGTDDNNTIKELAAEVTRLQERVVQCEREMESQGYELGRRQDEINRLKKLKWYDKVTIWKKIKNI
jgi:uncharacterized protein YceH (UPF0502 family)